MLSGSTYHLPGCDYHPYMMPEETEARTMAQVTVLVWVLPEADPKESHATHLLKM